MKGYSAFPKAPALLKPHHQIIQCLTQDNCWGGFPFDAVSVFYRPSRLGFHPYRKTEMILFNPIAGGDKGERTFPKGISPKVNVIARLEFELAYFEAAVQRFSHYDPQLSWYYTRLTFSTELLSSSFIL